MHARASPRPNGELVRVGDEAWRGRSLARSRGCLAAATCTQGSYGAVPFSSSGRGSSARDSEGGSARSPSRGVGRSWSEWRQKEEERGVVGGKEREEKRK